MSSNPRERMVPGEYRFDLTKKTNVATMQNLSPRVWEYDPSNQSIRQFIDSEIGGEVKRPEMLALLYLTFAGERNRYTVWVDSPKTVTHSDGGQLATAKSDFVLDYVYLAVKDHADQIKHNADECRATDAAAYELATEGVETYSKEEVFDIVVAGKGAPDLFSLKLIPEKIEPMFFEVKAQYTNSESIDSSRKQQEDWFAIFEDTFPAYVISITKVD